MPEGNTAAFSASVNGTAPFTYSWYKNNSQISGANSSSYSTSLLTLSDNGSTYKCIITNCNSINQIVSNNAILTVKSNNNSVTFYHQIQSSSNRYFRTRHLLFNSLTGIGSPKICSDGSNSTIIRFVSIGSTVMNSLNFRIKENIDGNDTENFGSFSPIQRYADSIVCWYTHPSFVDNDSIKRTITLQIFNSDNSQIIKELPIEIYRAPVLMVHGLWGDPSTFNDMENVLFIKYYPYKILRRANYQPSNDLSFYENRNVVSDEINNLMLDALAYGYSSGKVDIIAHSMGGLLSRTYIQGNNFNNTINRLITMNTPHSGTQSANLLISSTPLKVAFEKISKRCVGCGAVNDLQVNSEAISSLRVGEIGSPIVPKRSIATTTDVANGNVWDVFLIDLMWVIPGIPSPTKLYNSEKNDLIVPLSSEIGGLAENYYTYDFKNISHMESTSNPNNINDVMELLKKSSNNSVFFATTPFNPPVLEEGVMGKTLAKSKTIKITDSATVIITSPPNGTVVSPGQIINVTISSIGDINKLLFAATTQQKNIFSEVMESSSGIFQYTIPSSANGLIDIIALGSGVSGSVGIDSIKLNVTISASLDSISVYPKNISLPQNKNANISLKGYYSDGIERDISNDPTIMTISTDSNVVKVLSPVYLSADSIGFADVNIAYFGKTAQLNVTVLPANAFGTSNIDQGKKKSTISEYELAQNYPNPFNPNTTIKYSIPRPSIVKIKIYDILGREIAVLVNEEKSAGNYSIKFNGSNLPSGMYFYRLQAGNFVATKKFVLLK